MTLYSLLIAIEWVFLLYFVCINTGYFSLNFIALWSIRRHMKQRSGEGLPFSYSEFMPPVSVLIPAYNEEKNIVQTVRSVLQLDYPELEIIVINDGSTDNTLEVLRKQLKCEPLPEVYYDKIDTQAVRGFYRSQLVSKLRVLDKENGGKADALNAGINAARYPLFCAMDGDSILEENSLQRLVEPFLEDPDTIACGGSVRLANGSQIKDGFLEKIDLPLRILPLFQIIEYLRAFLFGRMGWSPLNALLIISGAFGLFDRLSVIEAGGYKTETVAEDMELVIRLHRLYAEKKEKYKIKFVPDPICWTEGPEDLNSLRTQRIRWHRGLCETMWMNLGLCFKRGSGLAGWLAYPFWFIFEMWGPVIEIGGYVFIGLGFWLGFVSPQIFLIFFILAIGVGVLISVLALLLEEISFHIYPKISHSVLLFFAAVLENFGYRQLNSYWRLVGLLKWLTGAGKGEWGTIKRKGFED